MLNDIYNKRIIELAGNIPRLGRLSAPDATRVHTPGSNITPAAAILNFLAGFPCIQHPPPPLYPAGQDLRRSTSAQSKPPGLTRILAIFIHHQHL